MQRFYLNLSPELNDKIEQKAWVTKKTKAEVAREALTIGLQHLQVTSSRSAKALLDLATEAEQIPTKGKVPKDAVTNMDFYTWGGEKRV